MSNLRLISCSILALMAAPSLLQSEVLFEWHGGDFPREVVSTSPPSIEEDEVLGGDVMVFSKEDVNYFEIPYPPFDTGMTFMLWVKPSLLMERANTALMSGSLDTGEDGVSLRVTWTRPMFRMGTGVEMENINTGDFPDLRLDPEFWQQLAVVFDEGTVRFYKDGRLIMEEETPHWALIPRLNRELTFGAYHHPGRREAYAFDGAMAHLVVADHPLSDEEVLAHYEQHRP